MRKGRGRKAGHIIKGPVGTPNRSTRWKDYLEQGWDGDEMNKSSMLYWEEKVAICDIPSLRRFDENKGHWIDTEIVPVDNDIVAILDGKDTLTRYADLFDAAAERVGYPVFMRTDHTSAKHSWADTCYVEKNWRDNIVRLIDESFMNDLPIGAIVFRLYVEMDSIFTAFNGMPVNPERRYFINDAEVICHHPYWIPEAIEQGTLFEKLPENWRKLLRKANTESLEEILLLGGYASKIARGHFREGGWSVDFCKGKDGVWYFIDMAEGWRSWHPDDCPHKSSIPNPLGFDYGSVVT